jgi:hypothetical protein
MTFKENKETRKLKQTKSQDRIKSKINKTNSKDNIKHNINHINSTHPYLLIIKYLLLLIFRIITAPFIFIARLPYTITKWCYKEGWWYSLGLIGLIITGILLRLNGITNKSINYDEAISITVAQNIAEGIGRFTIIDTYYGRAKLFHDYLSIFYKFSDDLWIGIVANMPFVIITLIILYFFGKLILNKNTGLFASFLFSFSWFAIAMSREIRFYEMFICFLLISLFLFYNIILIFLKTKGLFNLFFNLKFLKFLFLFVISFAISIETHKLSFFVFYSFLLFGILLFILNRKKASLIISFSLIILLVGNYYKYKELNIFAIFEDTLPSWFISIMENAPFLNLINELSINGFFYIYIIVFSSLFLLFKHKKISNIYLCSILFGIYYLLSIFGAGYIEFLRYYYMLLPFLLIFSSYVINEMIKINKKIIKFFYFILLLVIFINSIMFSINESNSIKNYNNISRYGAHNLNYFTISNYIYNNEEYMNYTIISDNQFAFVNYIYTKKKIDFVYSRNDILRTNSRERFTRIKYLTHYDIKRMVENNEKIILIKHDSILHKEIDPYINLLKPNKEIKFNKLDKGYARILIFN